MAETLTQGSVDQSGIRFSKTHKVIQMFKAGGSFGRLYAAYWKLKTALSKRCIQLQDRLSLYTYTRWIEENESALGTPLPENTEPLFSLIIPITRGDLPRLSATLASLHAQTHLNWEARLVYEPECASELTRLLKANPMQPARLLLLALDAEDREVNWLNLALREAHGDWVGVMHCGDTLSPLALAYYADCIHRHPQAVIIYPDEDCLAPDGSTRRAPFFKPDWSPELFLSVNYLAHAIFRQKEIAACIDSAQDWEEAIYRCAERAKSILHIPKVLYHVTSAQEAGAVPQDETIRGHLQRLGLADVKVIRTQSGKIRVSWSFEPELVSIVIPTRDQVGYLRRCLDSILGLTSYPRFEIILVENQSRDPETLAYYEQLRGISQIKIIQDHRAFNFSAANNLGARQAQGKLLLFLNNDVEVLDPDWLEEIARWLSRREVGVVGARLLYPDDRIQHAGIVIGLEGHASHIFGGVGEGYSGPFGSVDWYRNYSAVTGACMGMRREVFAELGGFDESYQLVFSDVDICLRAVQKGYRVVYTPFARLIHHEGRTRHRRIPAQDIQRGYEVVREIVSHGDPFYNPNLSYALRTPSLKRSKEETPIKRLEMIVRTISSSA